MGCTWGQKWLYEFKGALLYEGEPIKKWDHVLQKLGGTIILTFTTVFFVQETSTVSSNINKLVQALQDSKSHVYNIFKHKIGDFATENEKLQEQANNSSIKTKTQKSRKCMRESAIGKKILNQKNKCITSCPKKCTRISDMLTLAAATKSFFSLSVANQVLFGREYISSL